MSDENSDNLPSQIADAVSSVPKSFVPNSLKALDRLVGAAVDIPVAWLNQQKAKIDAHTNSIVGVEKAISDVAATEAGASPEIVQAAMNKLVRQAYRKKKNLDFIGVKALEDLRDIDGETTPDSTPEEIDDDWLNVFEKFAENASSDRMQDLWSKVLSGEIRRPGKFSLRTLRFLSEFSQSDAELFSDFSCNVFGGLAPRKLLLPRVDADLRNLLQLEAAGLIGDVAANTLTHSIELREIAGYPNVVRGLIFEGSVVLGLFGKEAATIETDVIGITPVGMELINLFSLEDRIKAAEKISSHISKKGLNKIVLYITDNSGQALSQKILWASE